MKKRSPPAVLNVNFREVVVPPPVVLSEVFGPIAFVAKPVVRIKPVSIPMPADTPPLKVPLAPLPAPL